MDLDIFKDYFPVFKELPPEQQKKLLACVRQRVYKRGELLHKGSGNCTGLVIVLSGQLRVWLLSEGGREVTLYRLFERDICLFSASCVLPDIQFDMMISAMEDTRVFIIPAGAYQKLLNEELTVANYTNRLMASRFSEVMWLIEQILFQGFDRRLADFLIKQAQLEGGDTVTMTHGEIAGHLGTAREVVSRMLKYFQTEGWVEVRRRAIHILQPDGLPGR